MAAAKASPLTPRWCDQQGCSTRIILALRADTGRWVPYEAEDRTPGSLMAAGCHVLVGAQAWKPSDLVEHFRAQFEITRERAEALVVGYPHHRPHFHLDDD